MSVSLLQGQRLQPLIVDGLVLDTPLDIRVTSHGRLLLRIIAMHFDAYLHDNTKTAHCARVIWPARLSNGHDSSSLAAFHSHPLPMITMTDLANLPVSAWRDETLETAG